MGLALRQVRRDERAAVHGVLEVRDEQGMRFRRGAMLVVLPLTLVVLVLGACGDTSKEATAAKYAGRGWTQAEVVAKAGKPTVEREVRQAEALDVCDPSLARAGQDARPARYALEYHVPGRGLPGALHLPPSVVVTVCLSESRKVLRTIEMFY